MKLPINNTFTSLPADIIEENYTRQVSNAFFSYVNPAKTKNPTLVHASREVANLLGMNEDELTSSDFLNTFSGNTIYENTKPFAMCYGGHQFGNWAGQLGDGRAINLFEINSNNKQWAVQLKGVGKTPYSRTADGLAVLRSSIREHLCSEAMYSLGVPTTRSLALMLSGDDVLRDVLYNGNPAYEKGAIVTRVAPSFIRFGNFQLLASRNEQKNLKILADYTIKHFYPKITSQGKEKYLEFYQQVVANTLKMIVEWQRVGFVHGVMNTDNMSILGLTIDYGPYGWLEDFNPDWTPNTTDSQHRRYRYGNQPDIGLWNLAQLGNALYSLIEDIPAMENILKNYNIEFDVQYHKMMPCKLGLMSEYDAVLHGDLQNNLMASETDMTIFYRELGKILKSDEAEDGLQKISFAFYKPEDINNTIKENWLKWFAHYLERLNKEVDTDADRRKKMNLVNPKFVLRNYMAQLAIDKADKGDYSIINELYALLKKPYDEQIENEHWFAKRPEWARHKVGCSMLSCSS